MSNREPDAWQTYRNQHVTATRGPETSVDVTLVTQMCRALVLGLPLAFVVLSWLFSPTFSTDLSDDESIVAFLQAQNAEASMAPGAISISVRSMDRQRHASSTVTNRQPSVPRLMHYLLLGAGLRDLAVQALIVSLLGTAVTVALLWRLFGQPALLAVGLAAILDYSGFLAWTIEPTRIWALVFYFGLLLAIKRDRPVWFGLLAFGLALLDYRLTAFIGVAALVFAVLTHGWRSFLYLLLLIGGPLVSVGLYALEVLAFSGLEEFQLELAATHEWLVPLMTGADPLQFAVYAWQRPLTLLGSVVQDTHNVAVFVLAIGGVVSSAFVLTRYRPNANLEFLSRLTVSVFVGLAAVWSLLLETLGERFTGSALSVTGFLIAPALGVMALELRTLLLKAAPWDSMGPIGTALVLVPLVLASVARYEPPFQNEAFRQMQANIRAYTTTSPDLRGWLPLPDQSSAAPGADAPGKPQAHPADAATDRLTDSRQSDQT